MTRVQNLASPTIDPQSVEKVVLICREGLGQLHAVNAAVVLGMSVGHHLPGRTGPDVHDASGTIYPGITTLPVPILTGSADTITHLFRAAATDPRVAVSILTDTARRAKTYEEYIQQAAEVNAADEAPVALALYGPRNRVTKLTKRLPLMA